MSGSNLNFYLFLTYFIGSFQATYFLELLALVLYNVLFSTQCNWCQFNRSVTIVNQRHQIREKKRLCHNLSTRQF